MSLQPNLVFLALAVGLVAFVLLRSRGNVAPAQARALVEAGARLVDVRSAGEFAAGHIAGAINIPVGEVARRAGEIGSAEKPVVVYCASGVRSAAAARTLKAKGFVNVKNLGAMSRW
jgi:phage shock protein E